MGTQQIAIIAKKKNTSLLWKNGREGRRVGTLCWQWNEEGGRTGCQEVVEGCVVRAVRMECRESSWRAEDVTALKMLCCSDPAPHLRLSPPLFPASAYLFPSSLSVHCGA